MMTASMKMYIPGVIVIAVLVESLTSGILAVILVRGGIEVF